MCDMQKNIRIELATLLLYHREKTLQKVTVTVMVNDCTTISISDMSAVFKYYMVNDTDCHLSLRVVQYFYTSQSLGTIDPSNPPPPK